VIFLEGVQLALLPEVTPYEICNLPRLGDSILTESGWAIVTRLQPLGTEFLVWADYGSGIEQPHGRKGTTCNLNIVLGGGMTPELEDKTVLGGELSDVDDPALKVERKACGWIGWKEAKRERKKREPWICRQAWLYWEEAGGKKRSRYIPKGKLAAVQESVYELRQAIGETLELLEKR
jgi:hypothetical protein